MHRRRLIFARDDLKRGKKTSPYYKYLPADERPVPAAQP